VKLEHASTTRSEFFSYFKQMSENKCSLTELLANMYTSAWAKVLAHDMATKRGMNQTGVPDVMAVCVTQINEALQARRAFFC